MCGTSTIVDCGQVIGIAHGGCNTNEPNSVKIMDWQFGPGIISNMHVRHNDRLDAPKILPQSCEKCVVRKVIEI